MCGLFGGLLCCVGLCKGLSCVGGCKWRVGVAMCQFCGWRKCVVGVGICNWPEDVLSVVFRVFGHIGIIKVCVICH